MEKKSLAKNILNLFITTDENSDKKPTNTITEKKKPVILNSKPQVPVMNAAAKQGEGLSSQTPPPTGANIDATIAQTLADALQQNNQDGFDYFEYAKTVDALKATIPAETTLYQSAFASATVMGASKQTLLQSADHYLKVLDTKAVDFENACTQEYEVSVKGKIQQMAEIEKQINQKAQLIQELTTEINNLSQKKETYMSEIDKNKNKIETVKKNYSNTWQIFSSRIRSDIEKINKYLGEPG